MPAEEDYTRFSELADEMELEGDERENYIGMHMSKKGYRPVTSWADPEPEEGQQGSGFSPFGAPKSKETKREIPKRNSGSNWQYGKAN